MRTTTIEERTWWARPGLEVRDGRLTIAGRDAEAARARTGHTAVRLRPRPRGGAGARARGRLRGAGTPGLVRLALKAQREPALLRFLRERVPSVGHLDVCSPGEIDLGAGPRLGARGDQLHRDERVRPRPGPDPRGAGVHLNVDLLSQLDRVGRSAPGSSVGIRVNPRIGASREGGGETLYTGPRPRSSGSSPSGCRRALAIAARHGLTIDTVHFHVGDGYLDEGLPDFEETVRRGGRDGGVCCRRQGCPIGEVNTGGGLGVPQRAGDRPLDLDGMGRHPGAAPRRRSTSSVPPSPATSW